VWENVLRLNCLFHVQNGLVVRVCRVVLDSMREEMCYATVGEAQTTLREVLFGVALGCECH
jgi:hypothetical protein